MNFFFVGLDFYACCYGGLDVMHVNIHNSVVYNIFTAMSIE